LLSRVCEILPELAEYRPLLARVSATLAYASHCNDSMIIKKDHIVPIQQVARLVKCPSGYWIPETLFTDSGCIYCIGVHGNTTEEGRPHDYAGKSYHDDGTAAIVPYDGPGKPDAPLYVDLSLRRNARVQCCKCKSYYSIIDARRGTQMARCYNCRTGARRGLDSAPVVQCATCKDKWVFGRRPPADWRCAPCEYNLHTVDQIIKTVPLHLLFCMMPAIRQAIYNAFPNLPPYGLDWPGVEVGVEDKSKSKSRKVTHKASDFLTPELLHGPVREAPLIKVAKDVANMSELLDSIAIFKEKEYCCIGHCNGRPRIGSLLSACGKCKLLACRSCLSQYYKFTPGSKIDKNMVACMCREPVSANTLQLLPSRF